MRLPNIRPVILMIVIFSQSVATAQTVDERLRQPLSPQATASLLLDVLVKGIAGNSPLLLRRVLADTVALNDAPLARPAAAIAILSLLAGNSESKDSVFPNSPQFSFTYTAQDTAIATLADQRGPVGGVVGSVFAPNGQPRAEGLTSMQIVFSNGKARIRRLWIPHQEPSNAKR